MNIQPFGEEIYVKMLTNEDFNLSGDLLLVEVIKLGVEANDEGSFYSGSKTAFVEINIGDILIVDIMLEDKDVVTAGEGKFRFITRSDIRATVK